jgi:hypothetical protein
MVSMEGRKEKEIMRETCKIRGSEREEDEKGDKRRGEGRKENEIMRKTRRRRRGRRRIRKRRRKKRKV